jgi:hypothetical protein
MGDFIKNIKILEKIKKLRGGSYNIKENVKQEKGDTISQ